MYMKRNEILLLHGREYVRLLNSPPTGLKSDVGGLEHILATAFSGSVDKKGLKKIIQEVKCNLVFLEPTLLYSCTYSCYFHVIFMPTLPLLYMVHVYPLDSWRGTDVYQRGGKCIFTLSPPPPPPRLFSQIPPIRLFSQIHHLDFTSQIMMLLTCITLFRASRNKLKASISGHHHEWSNSVGKHFFLRLLAAVTPHYDLWVYVAIPLNYVGPELTLLQCPQVNLYCRRPAPAWIVPSVSRKCG